jgi:hypothetical protein
MGNLPSSNLFLRFWGRVERFEDKQRRGIDSIRMMKLQKLIPPEIPPPEDGLSVELDCVIRPKISYPKDRYRIL